MIFFRNLRGKTLHAFGDFNQTFLALALFAAGCRDGYAQRISAIK
jgi:hypothetical protein